MRLEKFIRQFRVPPGKKISLKKDYDPGYTAKFVTEQDTAELLQRGVDLLAEYQDKLYAQNTHALLIVLQAMDAAGKDGRSSTSSGLNPQGCEVHSFKAPSAEELDHDYLWRNFKVLPERGRIGIFNRSYYEEVLVARVHPEILQRQQLPPASKDRDIWKRRFREINDFERYLVNNGILVSRSSCMCRNRAEARFLSDRASGKELKSRGDVTERLLKDYGGLRGRLSHQHRGAWYVIR
jgi:polyphosphate kinase 2 (PPK2 family)